MPIFAVSQNFSTGFNGLKGIKNSTSNSKESIDTRMSQASINLVDANYGRNLVKNISFGAKLPVEAVDLTKKITAALHLLKGDEVILAGKDLAEAKNTLRDGLKSVPNVINKILFITDSQLRTPFAIIKNNKGYEEIINLGKDGELQVKSDNFHGLFNVKPKTTCFITDGDDIMANGVNFTIFNRLSTVFDGMNDIQKDCIKQIDLSKFRTSEIEKLNLRKLEMLDQNVSLSPSSKIMFKDVKGQDEAIEEIKEHIVRRMKYPNFYKQIKFGKNALFIGPPGTGKTLGARAAANELDIPFFYINPQLFEDMYLGNSGKNITAFYDKIRKNSPCLVFFDEMEATFGRRTGKDHNREASLNLHLEEISKLEADNIDAFILGATNRPEIIDPAMLRDGRFGTKIEFKLPTVQGCRDIFNLHAKEFVLDGVDVDKLAETMNKEQFSGANIAGLISDTALAAARRLNIFEKMDAGTFVDDADFKHVLTQADFDKTMRKKTVEVRELMEKYSNERTKTLTDDYILQYNAQEAAKKELKPQRPVRVGFIKEGE